MSVNANYHNRNDATIGKSPSFPKLIRYGKDRDAHVVSLPAEVHELIPHLRQKGLSCYEFPDIDSETFELIRKHLQKLDQLPITEENVDRLNDAAASLGLESLGTYCDKFYKRRVIFEEGSQQSYPIIQELYKLSPKLREQQTFPVLLEDCDETVLKVINAYAKDKSIEGIDLADTINRFDDAWRNSDQFHLLNYLSKILKAANFLEIKDLTYRCVLFIRGAIASIEERWKKRAEHNSDWLVIAETVCRYYNIADQNNIAENGFRDLKKRCKKILRELLAENLGSNPDRKNCMKQIREYLALFQKYDINLKTFEANVDFSDLLTTLDEIFEKQNKIRTLTLHAENDVEFLPSRELERNLKHLATSLNSFHLIGENLGIDSLTFLLPCQKLKNLGLQVEKVTNAIWPYLPFLTSLKSLKFYSDSTVIPWEDLSTKKALDHLPQCENLKSIEFYEVDEDHKINLLYEGKSMELQNEKFQLSEPYLKQFLQE